MLIERVWNRWTISHATDPNGTGLPIDLTPTGKFKAGDPNNGEQK